MAPTINENRIAEIRRGYEMDIFRRLTPRYDAAANETRKERDRPIIAPIIPPASPRRLDSIRKMVRMSEFFAPTAFIIPISFLLSRTDVYIVFIIPIPPTTSEIAAIPMTIKLTMLNIVFTALSACVGV